MPVVPATLADSIAVGVPRDRIKALRAVRDTGGEFHHRQRRGDPGGDAHPGPADGRLCRAGRRGAAGRPAQDARARAAWSPEDRIVVVVTGNGLKDVSSAVKAAGTPHRVDPDVGDLKRLVERLGLEKR